MFSSVVCQGHVGLTFSYTYLVKIRVCLWIQNFEIIKINTHSSLLDRSFALTLKECKYGHNMMKRERNW